MYFESHAHYDDRRFREDGEALLGSFPSLGIAYVVNVGCDVKSSKASIRMAEKFDHVYASVGIHPSSVQDMSSTTIDELKRLSAHKKVVAIGEIGLDYHYDDYSPEAQRFWFRQQLRLAEEVNLPVIIHSRDASEETFDIIKSTAVRRGVIHCYSGAAPMALEYAKMGFYIGVGGVVTYSNARKLVEVVEALPLERIVIETDCPYLSPTPNRGKRNDSRNLQYVVEKIADIKNVTPDEVRNVTMQNGKSLYF